MESSTCAHCSKNLQATDDVYVTECGHLCHQSCLLIWPKGEWNCPKCSSNTRINRKLCLTTKAYTGEVLKDGQSDAHLREQLEQSVFLRDKLQQELNESDISFEALLMKFTKCDAEKEELDKWVKNSEIQLENIETENSELRNEIKELSERYESVELELREENASLKRNLRQLTLDLEKEIDTSSTLRKEKTKLEENDSKLRNLLEASEEQLKQNSQELDEQKNIIKKSFSEIKQLENKLKQIADTAKKHQTAAATLKIKIEYLTKDINCKNREIEILKEEASRFAGYQNANPTTAVNEKIKSLEYKLKEMNAALEEELKNSSEWRLNKMKLERQLEQCEAKIIDMEEERVKSEQILKMNIEKLTMEKNRKIKEVAEKTKENKKLAEKIDSLVSAETEVLLRGRIASLNKKLDEAFHEIENQSKLATALAQDKLKIQVQLAQNKKALKEAQGKYNKELNELRHKMPILKNQKQLESSLSNATKATASAYNASNVTEKEETSFVLCGIPKKYMGGQPVDIVIKFAEVLDIKCMKEDIEKAYVLENSATKSSLFVKFKKLDLRGKFFANRQKLKPEGICINEFVDKKIHALYQYAKSLKSAGYDAVYTKNNTVFVKKIKTSPPLKINSKEEVDKLIKSATQNKSNSNLTTSPSTSVGPTSKKKPQQTLTEEEMHQLKIRARKLLHSRAISQSEPNVDYLSD